VAEILAGKEASKSGREFARKPFSEAAKLFLEDRKGHVADRTIQFERERLKPLGSFFGETPLMRIGAEDIRAYQRMRLAGWAVWQDDQHGCWRSSPDDEACQALDVCGQ
jgi:hypothetical protein